MKYWLLLATLPLWAQNPFGTATRIQSGPSLPIFCAPGLINAPNVFMKVTAGVGTPYYCSTANTWTIWTGGGGGVSSVSAGNLSPLFTASVATPTTTPAISFSLDNFNADNIFGNFTGSSAAPSTQAIPACPNDGAHALVYASHVLTCESVTGGGGSGNGPNLPSYTYNSSTSVTFGANCTSSNPCNIVNGASPPVLVAQMTSSCTAVISGTTSSDSIYASLNPATAHLELAQNSAETITVSGSSVCAPSGITGQTNYTGSVPLYAPLAITANAWPTSAVPVYGLPSNTFINGTGMFSQQSGVTGALTLQTDPNSSPLFLQASSFSGTCPGQRYIGIVNSGSSPVFYVCPANTLTWTAAGGSSGPSKYVVQGCAAQVVGGVSGNVCIFNAPVTAGHAVYVCTVSTTSSALTFTSPIGTFTADPGAGTAITGVEFYTGPDYITCAYKLNATGGGAHITVTPATGSPYLLIWAVEIAGVTALDKSDNGSSQNSNSTAVNSGSITPSDNNDLVIGVGVAINAGYQYILSPGTNVSWAIAPGTLNDTEFNLGMQFYLQSTAASIASQMTIPNAQYYWAHVIAFN